MTAPELAPGLVSVKPYVQGKSALASQENPIKLSSNESALGPSPSALSAFESVAKTVHRYPDGTQSALRSAIAEVYCVPDQNIVCGNGSEELISLALRCFVRAGDEVVLTRNHFVMCPIYAAAQDANVVYAPERDKVVNVDRILEVISPRTRAVIVANPNNPTGTYVPAREIDRLVGSVPPEVLVILDGAYAEYVVAKDFDDGVAHALSRPNVMVTHTFSKIYGLAGLRVGWAVAGAPILDAINRLRTPFNVSSAAQAAAAAAVSDQAFVARAREHNRRALDELIPAIRSLGFAVTDSVANFYLVDVSTIDGADTTSVAAALEDGGVIPRPAGPDGLLRITVGTDEENARVLKLLRNYRKRLP